MACPKKRACGVKKKLQRTLILALTSLWQTVQPLINTLFIELFFHFMPTDPCTRLINYRIYIIKSHFQSKPSHPWISDVGPHTKWHWFRMLPTDIFAKRLFDDEDGIQKVDELSRLVTFEYLKKYFTCSNRTFKK